MYRITKKMLESRVAYLNEITDSPMESYHKDASGKFTSNIGHHYISFAYGGVSLERIVNPAGACQCPLGAYHRPKRELFDALCAYIDGIEQGKRLTA